MLEELMDEDIAGAPISTVRWSRRSTYQLSEELKEFDILACPSSVGNILKDNKFSLRANRKCIAETYHPDRNRQFEIITKMRKRFEDKGQPIISIDSKKKELIGNFKNSGKTWRKTYDQTSGRMILIIRQKNIKYRHLSHLAMIYWTIATGSM